ncbi:hypothetical protein FRC04_001475 [Tulasnella sp. 424]|nr:hypothetical protein FRC04_001475 [Tulasnella sp. 424]KAG8974533.1 hypothetical protein FRC05_007165 [Tulasnella sp. 425]
MTLVGGCLDHVVAQYSPNPGVCSEWEACLFFVVVACLCLAAWVGLNHAMKSRDLCVPVIQQILQQSAQQRAARRAAAQAAAQAPPPAPPPAPPAPETVPAATIAHPAAAGPTKELSESTMASKLPSTRDSSAWAPGLPYTQNRDSKDMSTSAASEFGALTPPASPPPSTLPPWIRTSRMEDSQDSVTISSVLTPSPMHADSALPPAAGPNASPQV